MRVLSTRAHGFVDYLTAALLLAAPWLLGFAQGGAETWIPVLLGLSAAGYSLSTDYELGVWRRIQMPVHLWLDAIGGLVLAASPWLFAFDSRVWIPHLVIGLGEIGVATLSDTIPGYERRGTGRSALE